MRAFYSDHFVLPLPEGHSFPMSKYSRLRVQLAAEGVIAAGDFVEAPAAAWDDLVRVHTREYIDAVAAGTIPREMQRRIGFPWSPGMVERSRRSVGATIAAAEHALASPDRMGVNLAGGTHHAFPDRGEGFCVFNDVAVAARRLVANAILSRVAIVDCDVHQGNGTAAIFRTDPSVFTFSIHGEHNFPFRKEQSDLDVALPDGTGDDDYLAQLEHHLADVLERHRPDFVFYLAGADPYEHDRWGRLRLTLDGLRRRDELVFSRTHGAGLPVAVTMAGGYARDVEAIVAIHVATVRAAMASVAARRRDASGG